MKYWLMKTEPSTFSLEDLKGSAKQTTPWDGIRNYQARNLMRDEMKTGDRVIFYHSNANPAAAVGTATIVREAYPDHTAWDPGSKYFDPKASPDNPVWLMVDVRFESEFHTPLSLQELREVPELKDMMLLKKGMRLSIQPVTPREFEVLVALGRGV